MKTGIVFAVEEFAVYDGPGPRVNVFLKGCPLRCQWCHNPEGWERERQIIKNVNGCIHCGRCKTVCRHPQRCILCKLCIVNCPKDLIRVSGTEYTSEELALRLKSYQSLLTECGGGITFSGGEVLMQTEFLCEVIDHLHGMDLCIETCGYGETSQFERLITRVNHVFYDLKIMDPEKHKKYTGKNNALILQNAKVLMNSGVPFTIRIPLIRNVNCDAKNMRETVTFLNDAENLKEIELLPYNRFAGAKYSLLGMVYRYKYFQPPDKTELQELRNIIESSGLKCKIREPL